MHELEVEARAANREGFVLVELDALEPIPGNHCRAARLHLQEKLDLHEARQHDRPEGQRHRADGHHSDRADLGLDDWPAGVQPIGCGPGLAADDQSVALAGRQIDVVDEDF